MVRVDAGKGGFHHAVDGRECPGVEDLALGRRLAAGRLEAGQRHLLLHEHDQDVAHLLLAEDAVAVRVKEVERRLEALLDCTCPCHPAHEQVLFQLCAHVCVCWSQCEKETGEGQRRRGKGKHP